VTRPAGGYVLWLELPRRLKSRELLEAALENGICFAPGDVFSASDRYAHCLRLSCGYPWSARIEKGLKILGRIASEALARRSR
jgi:DNA-binding transcriptional MocR family regulator